MTRDEIILMANEAGLYTHKDVQPEILAFANLVAAHKAEIITAEAYRCGYKDGKEAAAVMREHMSRLLHAAARGARIQTDDRDDWVDAAYIPTADYTGYDYRIHPDDTHLQYGPVSTALRDCDGDFQWVYIDSEHMQDLAIGCAIFANYADNMLHEWQQNKDRLTRSLFLLILAEALADEGM